MNKIDLDHIVERKIGDNILLVDIRQNAIYEVDKFTALCIDLIKKNDGFVDYSILKTHSNKDIKTLKQEISALLEVLLGVSNE